MMGVMTTKATGASSEPVYAPRPSFHAELFADDGTPRPAAAALVAALERLGPAGLGDAGRRRDAIFMQQGITFETVGEDGPSRERPCGLRRLGGLTHAGSARWSHRTRTRHR